EESGRRDRAWQEGREARRRRRRRSAFAQLEPQQLVRRVDYERDGHLAVGARAQVPGEGAIRRRVTADIELRDETRRDRAPEQDGREFPGGQDVDDIAAR